MCVWGVGVTMMLGVDIWDRKVEIVFVCVVGSTPVTVTNSDRDENGGRSLEASDALSDELGDSEGDGVGLSDEERGRDCVPTSDKDWEGDIALEKWDGGIDAVREEEEEEGGCEISVCEGEMDSSWEGEADGEMGSIFEVEGDSIDKEMVVKNDNEVVDCTGPTVESIITLVESMALPVAVKAVADTSLPIEVESASGVIKWVGVKDTIAEASSYTVTELEGISINASDSSIVEGTGTELQYNEPEPSSLMQFASTDWDSVSRSTRKYKWKA